MASESTEGGGPSARAAGRAVHAAVNLNDAFAMPLAAMVRSALDALRPGWTLELHVLDGGLSDDSRRRLERSWQGAPLVAHWRTPDFARLAGLPVDAKWSQATYYRLLLPDCLPSDVDRVLYLDCDMVVVKDLVDLWEEPFHEALCLAVQDPTSAYFDPAAVPAAKRAYPEEVRVRNWRELGLPPESPYFNAGLLSIDLAAWRREGLARKLVDCLHENREHVTYVDQYALNVVCAGRWRMLDPRWNRPACLTSAPPDSWDDPLYTRDGWERLLADPWIVHYIGGDKPWHRGGPPAERNRLFAALDRTDWAGWRPGRTWGEWWERRTTALQRLQRRFLPSKARAA